MFTAIVSLGSTPARELGTSSEQLVTALNRYDQADAVGSWDDGHARIAQTLTWNTPESRLESVPHVGAQSGRVIAAWVRLDNRDALFEALGIDRDEQATVTDPMLVLGAYARWGERCVDHLLGDFSFVIYDPAERTIFAARDPLGVRPLYYSAQRRGDEDVVVVSTTAAVFHVVEGVDLAPSEEWLALFAMGISKSHTDTPWPQVKKLPGGHHVTFGSERSDVRPHRYHTFRDDPPVTFERNEIWVERYRAVLEEAVRCRLRTTYRLGAETSGGIDSSTCLGFAAGLWDGPLDRIHTFGFVHAQEEPDFILETSKLHGLENNHIHPPRGQFDPEGIRDRTLTVLGYPAEHGNGPGHDPFYAECEQLAVRTLLSGFGGDEVVTNPAGLLARELIDHRKFVLLYKDLHGRRLLKPLRYVRALQRHRRNSKMESHLMSAAHENLPNYALRSDVVDRYDLRARFESGWHFDEGYRTVNGFILGNRLSEPFVPTRLENCTLMAQSRGVDYRWPLFDVRLVQQYLSTPSIEKKRSDFGRYLHRRAITGLVPPKVQWKQSKYMGEPMISRQDVAMIEPVASLLDHLHPRLEAIVDREELTRLGSSSTHHAFRRHVANLSTLNRWLHRYHS